MLQKETIPNTTELSYGELKEEARKIRDSLKSRLFPLAPSVDLKELAVVLLTEDGKGSGRIKFTTDNLIQRQTIFLERWTPDYEYAEIEVLRDDAIDPVTWGGPHYRIRYMKNINQDNTQFAKVKALEILDYILPLIQSEGKEVPH